MHGQGNPSSRQRVAHVLRAQPRKQPCDPIDEAKGTELLSIALDDEQAKGEPRWIRRSRKQRR